jgi:hypothetical protein
MKATTIPIQKVGNDQFVVITKKDLKNNVCFLETNRQKSEDNIRKIHASVAEIGNERNPKLFWDEKRGKFCIYDGQHLMEVLFEKMGEKMVTCKFNPKIKTAEEATRAMILLNNTGKKWECIDYVNTHAKSGKEDYKILLLELKRKLQLTTIIQAYSQESRSVATKLLKSGEFKIKDKEYGDLLLDNISECMKYSQNTRQMGEALVKFMLSEKKYNQTKMLKKLKSLRNNFQYSTKEGELLQQIKAIYKS